MPLSDIQTRTMWHALLVTTRWYIRLGKFAVTSYCRQGNHRLHTHRAVSPPDGCWWMLLVSQRDSESGILFRVGLPLQRIQGREEQIGLVRFTLVDSLWFIRLLHD